jgi:hypothetical protein
MRNQTFDELISESEQLTVGWDKEPPMDLFEYTENDGSIGLMTKAGSKFPQKMLDEWLVSIDTLEESMMEIDKLQKYIDNYQVTHENANM